LQLLAVFPMFAVVLRGSTGNTAETNYLNEME
jgi:hypothetical protein